MQANYFKEQKMFIPESVRIKLVDFCYEVQFFNASDFSKPLYMKFRDFIDKENPQNPFDFMSKTSMFFMREIKTPIEFWRNTYFKFLYIDWDREFYQWQDLYTHAKDFE